MNIKEAKKLNIRKQQQQQQNCLKEQTIYLLFEEKKIHPFPSFTLLALKLDYNMCVYVQEPDGHKLFIYGYIFIETRAAQFSTKSNNYAHKLII